MGKKQEKEFNPDVPPFQMPESDAPMLAHAEAPAPEIEDDIVYFDEWKPEDQGQIGLPFSVADHGPFAFKYFRYDEVYKLNGSVRCAYWRPVKKDLAMFGVCMADLFVPESDPAYPFDKYGLIPYGRSIRADDGRECRESYLAVRPAAANDPEQKIRARQSAEAVSARHVESGSEVAAKADKIAKAYYGQAQDTTPLVASQLTSFDAEMRKNMVTSDQYAKLGKPR